MKQSVILSKGDVAPLLSATSIKGEGLVLARLAGKRILLCFFADLTSADGFGRSLLESWLKEASLFDGQETYFIGVGYRPQEAADPLFADLPEGMTIIWDPRGEIAKMYGAAHFTSEGTLHHHFLHYILDVNLTIFSTVLASEKPSIDTVKQEWGKLTPLPGYHSLEPEHAPVLVIPHVFEPALCQALIEGYRKNGGEPSGFMKEENGKTIVALDPNHKIRSDWLINDEKILLATRDRIFRRITPHIAKCFQFQATRIERYIVACYDGSEGGHFRAHRDNTTKGTAHRRFAVTINLNAEEYEGGELTFPEFGRATYRAPTGGAIVFSCSLMHQALRVTKGQRFCFLPFLYDETAAKIREANSIYLGDGLQPYKA